MFNLIRRIKGKKKTFNTICSSNNLTLDFHSNKQEINILKDIFLNREYADYFPFYKRVTIVDIGAHYGFFSIFASNNTNNNSKILAIEPNSYNFNQLNKNIKDSKRKNIFSLNSAVGKDNGKAKLYQGEKPNHSILKDSPLLSQNKSFEEVEIKTLENVIKEHNLAKIDFLKLDCEGAEYLILKNASKDVFDKITTISMEFHDLKDEKFTADSIINILTENGFDIVKFNYEKTNHNLNYGKIIATKK